MQALIPEKFRPYAKFVVALLPVLGALVLGLVDAFTAAGLAVPSWLFFLVALATSLGVYQVPNTPPALDPEVQARLNRSIESGDLGSEKE